jgi:hypothetical protein
MVRKGISRNLYLFASFDLANATEFKYSHPNWIKLYKSAFDDIKSNLQKNYPWQPWKSNGDELLFFIPLRNKNSIESIIKDADRVMCQSITNIHENSPEFDDIQRLSIKLTLWLANIMDGNLDDVTSTSWNDFQLEYAGHKEFLGKETDIGFRISKYTPRSKTCLSAALVYYLIKQKSSILKKVRIAGYQRLKGVWSNRRYPILWLFRAPTVRSIIRSFHYDEKWDNDFIEQFVTNLEHNPNYGKIEIAEFENMLKYLGLMSKYGPIFDD